MTELLVGTKKGLFVYEGEPGGPFDLAARAFAGEPVEYAMRDPRSGRLLASVTNAFYGPKLWFTDGDADGEWTQAEGLALPAGGDEALGRIWTIVAGPGDPDRLALGISAAGVWLTDDGGQTWSRGNAGIVPRYVPEEARAETTDLCVHNLQRARENPERIFMQFHGGVYRSDDAGRTWIDIAPGLPSDFAFPLAVDPADPDSAFVIPLTAETDRVSAGGRVQVYETRDAGASWRPRGDGLPQQNAYL